MRNNGWMWVHFAKELFVWLEANHTDPGPQTLKVLCEIAEVLGE
jgi:hypothetical protein